MNQNGKITFRVPEPDEKPKMWALRLLPSERRKLEELMGRLKLRSKTAVIRHLLADAHAQFGQPTTVERKRPWPSALAARVKAVADALKEATDAVTPAEMASRFARAKPEDVQEILETLVAMGLAHRGKAKGTYSPIDL